jgi:hypothetical protein
MRVQGSCHCSHVTSVRSGGSIANLTPSRCRYPMASCIARFFPRGPAEESLGLTMSWSSRDLCIIKKGYIPATFSGLESARIALAHIDVDIYRSKWTNAYKLYGSDKLR